jgi:hypothetical protein
MLARTWISSVFCVCVVCQSVLGGTYGGGSGTSADPYLISQDPHLAELSATSSDWGMCFELTADVNATSYTPITPFTGVFDANNHSISGFSYTATAGYAGFFGKVQGAGACVKNLRLVAPTISATAKNYVGAIAGSVSSGAAIRGCSVVGGSVSGNDYTGGIVGMNLGTVSECYTQVTVSGRNQVGGVVGYNDQNTTVSKCLAEGPVEARTTQTGLYCGGLIGQNNGTVTECAATGTASGVMYVGGLVGYNYYSNASTKIQLSYACGNVSGTSYVGGLVGWNTTNPVVTMCYSIGRASGSSNVGGLIGKSANVACVTRSFWDTQTSNQSGSSGGTGKTTADMQKIATFTIAGIAWDFFGETANGSADIWRMCVDDVAYPRLHWEYSPADVICPDGVTFADYAALADEWGQAGTGLKGDIDVSGAVDAADLAIFGEEWLQ